MRLTAQLVHNAAAWAGRENFRSTRNGMVYPLFRLDERVLRGVPYYSIGQRQTTTGKSERKTGL